MGIKQSVSELPIKDICMCLSLVIVIFQLVTYYPCSHFMLNVKINVRSKNSPQFWTVAADYFILNVTIKQQKQQKLEKKLAKNVLLGLIMNG